MKTAISKNDIHTGSLTSDLLQWSFSQHFHAENHGEEVIEHLLTFCSKQTQRNMLIAQLADEKKHVRLYSKVIEKIGLSNGAREFAEGYVGMVMGQQSLAEKIFCFQILTEAVSAAFCTWRLRHFSESGFCRTDMEVLLDEQRHLSMGHCLLKICDPDEVRISLSSKRRSSLIRELNQICKVAIENSIPTANPAGRKIQSSLFWTISKSILREATLTPDNSGASQ